MLGIDLSELPDFNFKGSFLAPATPEAIKRRAILRELAQSGQTISLFEARSLDPEELLAMAVIAEELAPVRRKDARHGRTADDVVVGVGDRVYFFDKMHPKGHAPVMSYDVKGASINGYLIAFNNKRVVPTRLVFSNYQTAVYAHKEFDAYFNAPDVRRLSNG